MTVHAPTPSAALAWKRRRLTRPAQYQRVLSARTRSEGRFFRVVVAESDHDVGHARLGITVSKRVDRRAVGRNRIKRLVRELFRNLTDPLPTADYVVVAKATAASASAIELSLELTRLLTTAGRRALPMTSSAVTMPPSEPTPAEPTTAGTAPT